MATKIRHFSTFVAGVQYSNPDGTPRQRIIRDLDEYEAILLEHDPGNEHDPNAVKVNRLSGEQIGFLSREVAAEIAPRKAAGWRYGGFVEDVREEEDDDGRDTRYVDIVVIEARPGVSEKSINAYINDVVSPQYGVRQSSTTTRNAKSGCGTGLFAIVLAVSGFAVLMWYSGNLPK